ncbi:protein DpdG [Variovorax sp. J22R133]|uniref:protein DpdG n=1 Tax=Variovorax brevis TaxID=3053503 RepID=UPI002574E863|nr:protein DpdG [Variovorax sp. J22R133]MDM0115663.1 protein DpdG [Variovorax sp. J22R133]
MGILNHPSDGLYSMVPVLYRTLARLGPTERQVLVDLCSAGLGRDGGNPKIPDALTRWVQLGLFEEVDGTVAIAPGLLPAGAKDDVALTEAARRAVLSILFSATNNEDLWGTGGASDLVRGLAWWLALDPYRTDMRTLSLIALQSQQVKDAARLIVQNDVRMNQLGPWAQFLGFAWSLPHGIVLDPTQAINRVLDSVLPLNQEVVAADFLRDLANVLPVLDGGIYRRAVEEELRPEVWAGTPNGWVSQALGIALRRLENLNRISFVQRADAGDGVQIPGPDGTSQRSMVQFTHVIREEVKQ